MELCKWRRDPERDEDPREFPRFKKLVICVFVILAGTMSGLCSTIYFPSIPDIQEDLNASSIGVTLSTSLFILFTGFAPIVWSSISDYFHVRRLVYISSLILFAISSLGCGFAQDIWTLVVLRCVQSVGASCAAVLGPGTISDLYPVEKRGAAMGILFLGYFGGPLMGPILGGIIAFYFSWRATFWFLVVYSSLICLGIFFFTVETYRPTDSPSSLSSPSPSSMSVELKERLVEEGNEDTTSEETKSEDTKNEDTKDEETKTDMESALITPEEKNEEKKSAPPPTRFNPFLALIFLRHPFVLFTAFSTGVSFASMFTIETVLPDQFQETYNLNTLEIGLCFMGGGLGNVLGSFTGGRYLDYFLAKRARERGGKIVSEDRYPPTIFVHGFVTLPVGCILFVWAVEKHLPLPVPIFGFGLLCFAMSQILLSGSTYLVDATGKGASATAAANCARNVMAFILSLVASPIINYVGVGYVGIISALLSILATCALLVNKVKGEQWRINGGFAHPR